MASDIKIVYHNNVFAGSGAPADGDLLTRDNSSHPKDSVYIDRDSGTVYVRKDTTLTAATDWQASSGGTTGGGGVTDVTYAELVALIGSSGLTQGAQYLITDYATVHYIFDSSGIQYLDTIITGTTEPLIITAVSGDKIAAEVKSTLYPQDIIYYDWNPDNWVNDLSFADFTTDDANPTIVPGFKGVITSRHDTVLDNSVGYDFRNCKFRRWKVLSANYNSASNYDFNNLATYNGVIYKSLKDGNINNQPDSSPALWLALFDLTITEYWMPTPSGINSVPSDSASFADFKTFSENGDFGTYQNCCRSNRFRSLRDNMTIQSTTFTLLSNNVIFLKNGGHVYSNDFGIETGSNTFVGRMLENVVACDFAFNCIGDNFNVNTIGPSFIYNVIGAGFLNNSAGSHCDSNQIGASSKENIFGNSVVGNSIGANATYNNIGSGFGSVFGGHIIKDGFTMNRVEGNIGSSIDFTSATHIYGTYNTTLFKRLDGSVKLKYYDNSDAQQIVSANA